VKQDPLTTLKRAIFDALGDLAASTGKPVGIMFDLTIIDKAFDEIQQEQAEIDERLRALEARLTAWEAN